MPEDPPKEDIRGGQAGEDADEGEEP